MNGKDLGEMITNSTPSPRYGGIFLPECHLGDESLYGMMEELRSAGVKIQSHELLTPTESVILKETDPNSDTSENWCDAG